MKVTQPLIQPRLQSIPCPTLRALANEGRIDVGPEGQVDLEQLNRAFKGLGLSNVVTKVLLEGGTGASSVHPTQILGQGKKELDIFRLRGSRLDHSGDTQILRNPENPGGVDEARLEALLSLSSDGKSLTVQDLAVSNRRTTTEEGSGLRDTVIGMAELAALLLVFGKRNEQGTKGLLLEDVRGLYHGRLPADFQPEPVGLMDVLGATAKLAWHRASASGRAQKGADLALDRQGPRSGPAAEGLRRGGGPAGVRTQATPPVSEPELLRMHQQRPEA